MKNKPEEKVRTKQDLFDEVNNLRFRVRPSTLLNDAMEDYARSQAHILIDEDQTERARTWNILGNQIVGHERF